MRAAVLQVLGDPRSYKVVRYIIDGSVYEDRFSAFAIGRWLRENGRSVRTIFLAPESLVTRIEDGIEMLRDRDEFERRMVEILGDVEVIVIPSVGVYSGKYTVQFKGSIENTIVYIFKELLKLNVDEIYADVSTGQNIYTASMIEALRKFATYSKLRSILQGGKGISLKLTYIPPVDREVKVEIYDLDVKAFFSLPKFNLRFLRGRKFFDELSRIMKTLRMAFNAIKYNVPLVFYHPNILNLDIDVERIVNNLLEIVEEIEERVVMDNLTVIRNVLRCDDIVNTFFAISILYSIVEFWREKISGRSPDLDEILRTFKEIYKNLGLDVNSRFLERDVEYIREKSKDFEGEILLLELLGCKESRDRKRNFFAHSGFLSEITKVKKREKITLEYDFESMRRRGIDVCKWLLNP